MNRIKNIKGEFPFFESNPDLVYLDSSATTQKPKQVIDTITDFYVSSNSNAGRSSYKLASKLTKNIEVIREKVKVFVNADSKDEIVFSFGATDSFNKITQMIGFKLQDGDEILYSPEDHKSFTLPWFSIQTLLAEKGVNITLVPYKIRNTGGADILDILSKVTKKTKVINITHVHNVYGADSDIHVLRDKLENKDIIINVDGTQAVGHMKVSVKDLRCDIYSFSGHKMFASQGIGVSYIAQNLQPNLKVMYSGGGSRIEKIGSNFVQQDFTKALESGTQNYAGILSLDSAIEFIQDIGEENIHGYLTDLTQYLLSELKKLDQVLFAKGPFHWHCYDGFGIISFRHNKVDSSSIGFILDQKGICVRTGDHCSLESKEDYVRVSLHIYNTKDDIDKLVGELKKISL